MEKVVQDVPDGQPVKGTRDSPLKNTAQYVDLQVTGLDGGVPRPETVVRDMCSEQVISRWGMAIEERDCNWLHGLNLLVDYRWLVSHFTLCFCLCFSISAEMGAISVGQEIGNTERGEVCMKKVVQDVPVGQPVKVWNLILGAQDILLL